MRPIETTPANRLVIRLAGEAILAGLVAGGIVVLLARLAGSCAP